MEISLTNVGRRFNANWIFRDLTYQFDSKNNYAILGENGSGKSTLMKLICGSLSPSSGEISLADKNGKKVSVNEMYRYFSIAAPYLELIEEFTLEEQVKFHKELCPFLNQISTKEVISITELEAHKDKRIKEYSSGMKQRVKLALAVLSDRPVLLLDEPTTNLDSKSTDWYKALTQEYAQNKLIIVSSNNKPEEYFMCEEKLQLTDYKK